MSTIDRLMLIVLIAAGLGFGGYLIHFLLSGLRVKEADMTEKALLKYLVVTGLLLLAFTAGWLCPVTVENTILSFIHFLVWLGD